MAMDIGAKSGVRSDINITPLVDVVLVLLIIFMVITPMLQRGKSVELPKARNAVQNKAQGPEPLFVSVTADGKTYIESDKVPASPEQLIDAMRSAVAEGKRVMVKADVNTEYGAVRPVLDRAAKAKEATQGPPVIFFDADDKAKYLRAMKGLDLIRDSSPGWTIGMMTEKLAATATPTEPTPPGATPPAPGTAPTPPTPPQ